MQIKSACNRDSWNDIKWTLALCCFLHSGAQNYDEPKFYFLHNHRLAREIVEFHIQSHFSYKLHELNFVSFDWIWFDCGCYRCTFPSLLLISVSFVYCSSIFHHRFLEFWKSFDWKRWPCCMASSSFTRFESVGFFLLGPLQITYLFKTDK